MRLSKESLFERVMLLAAWTENSGCALGGPQIRKLMADERGNTQLQEAYKRTGHRIGCRCIDCYPPC